MEGGPNGAARLSSNHGFALGFCPKMSTIAVGSIGDRAAAGRPHRQNPICINNLANRSLDACSASWSARLQFALEGYVFDPGRRELTRGSEAIAVRPQVFDLLASPLQNRTRVVSKAASHALAGRTDEARRAMQHLRHLDPTLRICNLTDWLPIRRPQDLAIFSDGLSQAELPE